MDLKIFREQYEKESEKVKDPAKIMLPDKDFLLLDILYEIAWRLRINKK